MRITFVLSLALASVLFLSSCTPAIASGFDIGYSKLDPTNPFYFLKTVREDIELKLALTPHVKNLRHLEFATRRLREARSLVNSNPSLIPASLERHNANLNTLLDRRDLDGEVVLRIESSLTAHLTALIKMNEDLREKEAKRSVRSAIDKIARRSDLASSDKIIACDFLKKEASSSALNQGEQVVILERAQNCSKGSGVY